MGTRITYKEMSEDLDAVIEAKKRDPLEKYELEIEGNIKTPVAMRVLEMMDEKRDFQVRAQFVKELLSGCRITVYKNGSKSFTTAITPAVEWWAIDEFNNDPMALRYVVTCVYTKFLKKFTA